jgi:hypothetical protein
MSSLLATHGKSVPWIETENSDTMNTIWNKSFFIYIPLATAIIAKTEDEAPLSPAHEIKTHCLTEHLKGNISAKTATGRAINVRNMTIINAVGIMADISCGNVKSPIRKNIRI